VIEDGERNKPRTQVIPEHEVVRTAVRGVQWTKGTGRCAPSILKEPLSSIRFVQHLLLYQLLVLPPKPCPLQSSGVHLRIRVGVRWP
jgi:hypothetical protein